MRCGKGIRVVIIIGIALFLIPASGMSQQGNHLWNVTDKGDTLRYVNIISGETQQYASGFPRYMSQEQFDAFLQSSRLPKDSVAYQANIERLFQALPEMRDMSQPLQPQYKSIWTPVLTATVSGALSAYFKLEANSAYARYNRSIDRDAINKYYDLTKKYDTYSAISFVFLQASFGWLSYKLLR